MTEYSMKIFTAPENKLSIVLALVANWRSHTMGKNERQQKLCEVMESTLVNGIGRQVNLQRLPGEKFDFGLA